MGLKEAFFVDLGGGGEGGVNSSIDIIKSYSMSQSGYDQLVGKPDTTNVCNKHRNKTGGIVIVMVIAIVHAAEGLDILRSKFTQKQTHGFRRAPGDFA